MTPSDRRDRPRPVVGMLQQDLLEIYAEQWLGAVDGARAHDCDLICFCGRPLEEPGFRRQSNAIYDVVSEEALDALIVWTSTLGIHVGGEKLAEFCRRFEPLPIVSVEQQLGSAPMVVMDNRRGMYEAVSHLIEVHGHRRIAFLRGPATHDGFQERYHGYLDALAKHGLTAAPELISGAAADAVKLDTAWLARILAAPPPPDAIVAADDGFAVAVMSALAASGLRTPDDIAVVGFDDSINVSSDDLGLADTHVEPTRAGEITVDSMSLTTVRAPFYELGRRAVPVALGLIRGEPVPDVTLVPTELVIRRSCGCPASISLDSSFGSNGEHDVLTQLRHALVGVPSAMPADWVERLSTAFVREVRQPTGEFLALLNEFIRSSVRSGERVESWSRVLSTLRQILQPAITGVEETARAEDTWRKAHLLLAGTAERRSGYLQVLTEKRHQIARDVGRELNTAPDVGGLTEALARELPKIGIPGCYLARYEPVAPSRSYRADSGPAGPGPADSRTRSRLLLAYRAGTRVGTGTGAEIFTSVRLVPGDHLRRSSPSSMVALPLYAKDQQLGFVLLEVGPRIGWIYTTLQEQLSSALHRALLIESDRAAQAAVEEAHRRAERQRLAGELHDSVSQALFSMTLHTRALQLAAQQDGADPHGEMVRGLAQLRDLTQTALAEMRALILQMRPESLHEEGLVVALRRHAAVLAAREGLDVGFTAPDHRLPLEEQAEEELLRVVQEAAHNSVKHARARHIDFNIWTIADPPGTLVVEVADDGTGFDPALRRPGHLGLRIMRERVERIGGRLTVDSAPSRSTTIRAVLPGALAGDSVDAR